MVRMLYRNGLEYYSRRWRGLGDHEENIGCLWLWLWLITKGIPGIGRVIWLYDMDVHRCLYDARRWWHFSDFITWLPKYL